MKKCEGCKQLKTTKAKLSRALKALKATDDYERWFHGGRKGGPPMMLSQVLAMREAVLRAVS